MLLYSLYCVMGPYSKKCQINNWLPSGVLHGIFHSNTGFLLSFRHMSHSYTAIKWWKSSSLVLKRLYYSCQHIILSMDTGDESFNSFYLNLHQANRKTLEMFYKDREEKCIQQISLSTELLSFVECICQ